MFPGGNFRLFRWRDIDVFMDLTAILIIVLYVAQISSYSSSNGLIIGVAVGTLVIASILLHELAHASVGMLLGAKVERIQLSVIGGLCVFRSKKASNWRDLLISLSGPAANFVLFFLFNLSAEQTPGGVWYPIADNVAYINLLLGVFNILPGYPLDGGQALRSLVLLVTRRELWAAWAVAVTGSLVGGWMIWVAFQSLQSGGTINGIFLGLIAYWIITASIGQLQSTRRFTGQALRYARKRPTAPSQPATPVAPVAPVTTGIPVGSVVNRYFDPSLYPEMVVADFLDHSVNYPDNAPLPVLKEGFLMGLTNRAAVKNMSPANQQTFTLGRVMIPIRQLQTVYEDEDLTGAERALSLNRGYPVPVLQRNGFFSGFITAQELEKVGR